MYLLGLDIGTSSVKALLRDVDSGTILAQASQEVPVHQDRPGYAEQVPAYWWQAAVNSVREAMQRAGAAPKGLVGIGLSGQMHGVICLNETLEPLRPAIIWADARSSAQASALTAQLEHLAAVAPGPPAAGYMASTLMWLAEHEPETLDSTAVVLLPKDYLRLRLTGEAATDPSDAAATWLFDVESGDWSPALLDACGLDSRILPPVLPSDAIAGTLTAQAAKALGLPAGIPVVTGCADQAAEALGYGLIEPGRILTTIGTGGQVFMPLTQPLRDPQMRCSVYNHAMSRRWYAAAAILSGGLALRWLRDLFGLNDYAHLSQLAAEIPRGAQGLVFLPYLAGERTPHLDPQASGMFLGLRLYHQRGHLARAVMEGVCFAMRDCLDLVSSLHDGPVEIIASGGAATSPVWQQIQADIYEHPLLLGHGEHHACVGAALLAGVGAGVYSSIEEAVQQIPRSSTVVTPDSESAAFYAERRELYRSLYPTLRDAMHRLSES